MNAFIYLINTAFKIMNWLIIIRVIISWIRPNVTDPNWRNLLRILFNITEPILGPIRRLLPQGNIGIDFSPFIALIALNILRNFVINLLVKLLY